MKGIIGTAGHIDHGKTELIRALTGQETDRLKEEKERGISIDLGFAYLDLPDGDRVGIVDVPGHERFIKNMLAGATGINLVLFVVAANDGVMPQTTEHLEILDLLNVRNGIGVITKADLVDEIRIEEVREELEFILEQTTLAGSEIHSVSAKTGLGIEELKQKIVQRIHQIVLPSEKQFFRMPIDRSFTIKGHGTVVTGTIFSGSVRLGDEPALSPPETEAKVRKVQVHNQPVDRAETGQRTALNLSRLEKGEVRRGYTLCSKEIGTPTRSVGVVVRPVKLEPGELKSRTQYHFHAGTTETLVTLKFFPGADLKENKESLAHVEFSQPVHLLLHDRFILRSADAKKTLGGGIVLLPQMEKPNRKNRSALEQQMRVMLQPKLDKQMEETILLNPSGMALSELSSLFNLVPAEIRSRFEKIDSLQVINQESQTFYVSRTRLEEYKNQMVQWIEETHKKEPNKLGVERTVLLESVGKRVKSAVFEWVIDILLKQGSYVQTKGMIQRKGFQLSFSSQDENQKNRILDIYQNAGYSPPKIEEVAKRLQMNPNYAKKIIGSLREMGTLVPVTGDVYFHQNVIREAEEKLKNILSDREKIKVAEYRDIMGFGRKLCIELLEYFDRVGLTCREGDFRRLVKK